MEEILTVAHVNKYFQTANGRKLEILKDINFSVKARSGISIIGPSGSGKTTLLGLCAGLDHPSDGSIVLSGMELERMSEDDRAYVRNQYVGFIFQTFQLLPTLTALENVMVPMELRGEKNVAKDAKELLERVGLGERMTHYPAQLSGGEQQRVAIARAIAKRPEVMLCDEPTGALDSKTGIIVLEALWRINEELKTTMAIITHNAGIRDIAHRVFTFRDGRIADAMVNERRAQPAEVSW